VSEDVRGRSRFDMHGSLRLRRPFATLQARLSVFPGSIDLDCDWGKRCTARSRTTPEVTKVRAQVRFTEIGLWEFCETYREDTIVGAVLRLLAWTHPLIPLGESKRSEVQVKRTRSKEAI
jgi:hypothetical protein